MVSNCALQMIPPSLLVRPLQRVARLVSNVRASTRTALSVSIRSFWCGRWASTRDQRAALSPLVRVGRAKETNSLHTSPSRVRTPGAQERYGCRSSHDAPRSASTGTNQATRPLPYRYQLCLSRQLRACEHSSASLSQFPVMAAASYVVWANASSASSGMSAVRMASYGKINSRNVSW